MASKDARGTKRTCQNNSCGARFYDLNRDPIVCPVCDSKYVIASSPAALAALQAEERAARARPKKPVFDADAEAATDVAVEGEEVLADGDEAGDDTAPASDETFLEEEEEEGGDMSNIIGGPVEGGEEER